MATAQNDEAMDRAMELFRAMLRGECPYHHQVVCVQQIGRDVYAVDCGCFLFRGRVGELGWTKQGTPTVAGTCLPPPAAESR